MSMKISKWSDRAAVASSVEGHGFDSQGIHGLT